MKGKSCINIKITFIVSNPDEIYIANRAVIRHVYNHQERFRGDLLLYAGYKPERCYSISLEKNNT